MLNPLPQFVQQHKLQIFDRSHAYTLQICRGDKMWQDCQLREDHHHITGSPHTTDKPTEQRTPRLHHWPGEPNNARSAALHGPRGLRTGHSRHQDQTHYEEHNNNGEKQQSPRLQTLENKSQVKREHGAACKNITETAA